MKQTTDGSNLGQVLDTVVTGVAENSDLTRSELISDMANEADVEERTIERYITGDIECPPASRLEDMASALDVSAAAFMSALMQDGCDVTTDTMQQTIDQPDGIFVADGTWFAVGPDDHAKEGTDYPGDAMYPVDSCADIEDAWNLRMHGEDLLIERSTLEARIKRAAEAKNCSNMPWQNNDSPTMDDLSDAADRYSISGRCADCGDDKSTETDTMTAFDFDLQDLSAEAAIDNLADQHEGVEEVLDELHELRELKQTLDEHDLDGDDVGTVVEKADAYDELMQEQMEEDAERLAGMTDRFEDADDVLDEYDEHDDILDRIELLESVTDEDGGASETSETTTDSGERDGADREDAIRGRKRVPDAWT